MRRIRYLVATSLDGFLTGPNGEIDWITADPSIDFGALFGQFDTILSGRKTYDEMAGAGRAVMPGIQTVVCSRTLDAALPRGVTVVRDAPAVAELKNQPGKDIWLFGGGGLFRSLADAGLVDTVEVSVMPVLLGGGVPLAPGTGRIRLALAGHTVYPSGIVRLEYRVTT